MTRIGRVMAWEPYIPDTPRFRLVVECGHIQLGCWRAVGQEPSREEFIAQPNAPESRRTIFERVS